MSSGSHYIPASPGWLALFEDQADGELVVRSEPVVAWCFTDGNGESDHAAPGRAIIGARSYPGKGPADDELHCFALVREEQLDPSFVAELEAAGHHPREAILEAARLNQERRLAGHETWVRGRRAHRAHSNTGGVLRII